MNFRSGILNKLKNKINRNNDNFYKYDKIIDKKLNMLKDNENNKYDIGNFKVKRKIPNKNDLNKIYNNFLKNINNHKISNNSNNLYKFIHKKYNIRLYDDNKFLLFKLHLENKHYKLSIMFQLLHESTVTFILNNDKTKLVYEFDKYIKNKIIFNSNNIKLNNNYLEIYVIFSSYIPVHIMDLIFKVEETQIKNNNDITLIKNNNKVFIF